jgi:transposase
LPRLEEAQTGIRDVYFVDAAHFVFRTFLGMLWCFQRLFVPAPAGLRRFNVLGALHATNHSLITVTNESYINAESVCILLKKIVAYTRGLPITLMLDNARYQRCHLVQEFAKTLKIELLFLPTTDSLHLNLIARMWKYIKRSVCTTATMNPLMTFNKRSAPALTTPRTIRR